MTRRFVDLALVAGLMGLAPPALILAQDRPAPPAITPAPVADDAAKAKAAPPPTEPIDRIKDEGMNRSQVMAIAEQITEINGPRLTGSPGMKRANEWTRDKMKEIGLENAALESWGEFGRGWSLKKFSAQVVEPECIPLIAFPKAWSPGTDGPITGEVVLVDIADEKDFDKYKGKLKGAIVLAGRTRELAAGFEPLGRRVSDEDLLRMANSAAPGEGPGGGRRGGRRPSNVPTTEQIAEMRARAALAPRRDQFLIDEGAAAILDSSFRGDGGTLFVQQATVPRLPDQERRVSPWDKEAPKLLPQITVANEHYNRLVRLAKAGTPMKMTVELEVEFHDDDLNGYNTVAEIPGTDLKDEVVMLGGHLDSWHSATGATDNAAGCAVVMEAARILKALDLEPRRTVRVALWTGEEQGLFGSNGYVREHFGTRGGTEGLQLKPEHEKLSAYYNLDNGTGKIRGVYLQGNEAVRPIFRKWLAPFADLGAGTLTPSNTGGTDHVGFDAVGLPGFQFIQDPVEYDTRTHHSNMDVYDRLQADDLKQASVIMAAFVYNTAMMDEKLPRKPAPTSTPGPRPGPGAGGN